jgi:hypothetical protein
MRCDDQEKATDLTESLTMSYFLRCSAGVGKSNSGLRTKLQVDYNMSVLINQVLFFQVGR